MKIREFVLFCALLIAFHSCKTDQPKPALAENTEVRQWKPEDTRSLTGLMAKRGLVSKTPEATPGYILYMPAESKRTFLMDLDGNVVHTWNSDMSTMNGYLRENGHLFRMERDPDFPTFAAGGQAGRIREYDWDGNKLWDFKWADKKHLIHHDFEIMPNGNILAISYDAKTMEEAIAAGRDPGHVPKAGVWPDEIIEIRPTMPEGGEIVWEWHMWDHLIQDLDAKKANYGVVADHPGKININAGEAEGGGPQMTQEQLDQQIKMGAATSNATLDNRGSDITHSNAIGYNPALDQIVISVPGYNEIMIIDHSTSTEEAKGSTGGKAGHGGDIIYRWGNPANYGHGTKADQKLFGQHDVKWIPEGYPGAGDLTVFNNDILNPGNKLPNMFAAFASAKSPDPQISIGDIGNYSAVFELTAPTDGKGGYELSDNGMYGPEEPTWSYMAPDKFSLYSAFISGAQRMQNGNTFITSGANGRFLEVSPDKKVLWEYWNPYNEHYTLPDGTRAQPIGPFLYAQFRGTHIPADFPAFSGKDLKPVDPQPEPFVFKMPPPPAEKDSVQ